MVSTMCPVLLPASISECPLLLPLFLSTVTELHSLDGGQKMGSEYCKEPDPASLASPMGAQVRIQSASYMLVAT